MNYKHSFVNENDKIPLYHISKDANSWEYSFKEQIKPFHHVKVVIKGRVVSKLVCIPYFK